MRAAAVIVEVDGRGAVYLGTERYLAGESDREIVVSYVPGHVGRCRDMHDLVSRWSTFRGELPSYETVLNPGAARETMLADAQKNVSSAGAGDVREAMREKLGRDGAQSERAKRTNEARKKEVAPW